jgi:Holliday junction resolvase RusA-like endonuclease
LPILRAKRDGAAEVCEGMIVLNLPFPPSTNNLFINTSRGRIRSSKYDEWATEAGWELARQRPPKTLGPVSIHFDFQSGRDKRKRDITNLLKAPEDLLVKFGVIEADDNTIVREVRARWSECVKGVEITIIPIAGEDNGRPQQQRSA